MTFVCTFPDPLLHDYNVKMPNFAFYEEQATSNDEILFLFLNLDMNPRETTSGGSPTFVKVSG